MDTITSLLGPAADAVMDRLKNEMCSPVLEHFGVQRTSFLGRVICEFFEALTLQQVMAFVRGQGNTCNTIVGDLIQAIGEALVGELVELFGVNERSPMYTYLVAPIIEMITNSIFRNTEFTNSVSNRICSLDFTSLLQAAGVSGGAASALVSRARGGASSTAPAATSASPTSTASSTTGAAPAARSTSRD
jgi:hypothetical protein